MQDAVLIRARVRVWSGRKTDKEVSDEVAALKGATSDAGRYIKHLVDHKALRGLATAAQAVRTAHHEMTRPWTDDGRRLAPTSMLDRYHEAMQKAESSFMVEVGDFLAQYPKLREEAATNLGVMFNAEEYPEPETLQDLFGVDIEVEPVPDGSALPMGIKERDALVAGVNMQVRQTLKESMDALFYRTVNAIRHIVERIEDYSAKVEQHQGGPTRYKMRDGMFNDLISIASILPDLNIENDPFLTDVAARLNRELRDIDIDAVRTSAQARDAIVAALKPIAEDMEAIMDSGS